MLQLKFLLHHEQLSGTSPYNHAKNMTTTLSTPFFMVITTLQVTDKTAER